MGEKNNIFVTSRSAVERVGGGGSVLVLPFHSPINCLAHFACQTFSAISPCFLPFPPLQSYAVKKIYSLDKRFIKIKCPCNELFCTLEETSISTQVPTSL